MRVILFPCAPENLCSTPGLDSHVTPAKDRHSTKLNAILNRAQSDGVLITILYNSLFCILSTSQRVSINTSNVKSLGYGMILKSCLNSHRNYDQSDRSAAPKRCAIDSEATEQKHRIYHSQSTDRKEIYSHKKDDIIRLTIKE